MTRRHRNWAGNHVYRAGHLHEPTSHEALRDVVARGGRLRVLGSRHAFNDLVDTEGDLVSLARLPRSIDIDAATRTVSVDGGARYGDVCDRLHRAGFGLPALASLPHISVAGACATATHGSGDRTSNLATTVAAMELLTSGGETIRLDRSDPRFAGAVVSLGALGVITRLTLDLEPTYQMRQTVREGLAQATFERDALRILASADSVSCFTRWAAEGFHQVWRKWRVTEGSSDHLGPVGDDEILAGTSLAPTDRHPIPGFPAAACTAQQGVPGPWHERLPHFRFEATPSSGDEIQSEYYVGRQDVAAAAAALFAIGDRIAPLLHVSEIRTVAADDLWLSPAYERPSATIHFTWRPDAQGVADVLPHIERALEPFQPRPHWGKVFTLPGPEIGPRYARLDDFVALAQRLDPRGMFRNAYLERTLGLPQG